MEHSDSPRPLGTCVEEWPLGVHCKDEEGIMPTTISVNCVGSSLVSIVHVDGIDLSN